jgi:hypothetical protein
MRAGGYLVAAGSVTAELSPVVEDSSGTERMYLYSRKGDLMERSSNPRLPPKPGSGDPSEPAVSEFN